jgi:hypothetical protein
MIDGQILQPDSDNGMWVIDGDVYNNKYPTIIQQGSTNTPLASGKHHLEYRVRCTGCQLELYDRTLMAWVNIH